MTWTIAISVAIGIIFKFVMSPPSLIVEWVVSRFALHPKLNSNDVIVTFLSEHLVGEEKISFINYFNEATFLKKYYIFPGNESLFLHPESNLTPFVINLKKGNKDVNFYVYCYDDHIDVVKQYKKQVASYRLSSDYLQKFIITTKGITKNV
jgi:hypothetical protein